MDQKARKILKKLDKLMRSGNRGTAKFVAEEAIAYFERKKETLEREKTSKDQEIALAELDKYLGDVHKIMGEYDKALEYYRNMKELSKDLGKSKFLVDAYISMGEIHRMRGEWELALENLKKALKVAKASQHQPGESEASRLIGYVNWRLGRFKKAEDFFMKALKLAENLKDLHIQGKTYIDLGNLENERINLEQAQTYYNKALRMLERVGDDYELARVYNNMGDICIKRRDWVSGIKYFEKCNDIARKIRDPRWKGWAMFNAAECYSKSGRPKKAEEYCERAERALAHTEDKMAMAYVEINYGIAFRYLKEWTLSEEHFRKGLSDLEELRSPSVLGWAYAEFAHMKKDQGKSELAKEYLRKAISMYRKVGAKKFIEELTKDLSGFKRN
jgi:tetratricopeptide (TPR) repeat protein